MQDCDKEAQEEGSPPHTRGILLYEYVEPTPTRFTPAYAGNTNAFIFRQSGTGVHPRIRGEYSQKPTGKQLALGSPPHTRGILCHDTGGRQAERVHPRIRGEYSRGPVKGRQVLGSPPHTRGIPGQRTPCRLAVGFTPAYAGNTRIVRSHVTRCQVHPRIRGEYPSPQNSATCHKGSPPHTRGIQRTNLIVSVNQGFTPAYAGNTANCVMLQLHQKVHPRIRGEYLPLSRGRRRGLGSPPHTRGIRDFIPEIHRRVRFTPAYAGNTSCVISVLIDNQVHPRIRGEYLYTSTKAFTW